MGVFADKARKAVALTKALEAGEVQEEDVKKHGLQTLEINIEDHSRMSMPNLPQPLTTVEKKYLLAVERADTSTVKKMMQKNARQPGYMNIDCVDPLGRDALHMSIENENLDMVELLIVMGVDTKDSLLLAIDCEFVEAAEILLEHEDIIHKEGEPYSWEKIDRQISSFTPDITPLILAAHKNNYEILKILLDRGASLPMPHDIRCSCSECIASSAQDSLRHSMSRINAYKALASPSLIALSSTDPILTSFELSDELKALAYEESEFREEYLSLRKQCRNFATELLSHTRSSTELAVILNYDPEVSNPYEDGDSMKLKRLELAIDYKQKTFVAHANVQQLLAALWYSGLPGFRRLPAMQKLCQLVKLVLLFPLYCVQYMLFPDLESSKRSRTPFMKFVLHSASYLFFLLMLILFSVRFEELFVFYLGTENMRRNLAESLKRPRGNLPTPIEWIILLYVFGFIFEEIKEIKRDGIKIYFRNMWNILDVMRDGLYLMTMLLRIFAYIQQTIEISKDPQSAFVPREDWHGFDPQLISEGLFSAANVLSALKLVHIFSINPYLGPLQISLGRMVMDIVKFFFIYVLVLFAFACGLTQLLWYFNDIEKQKCYSLPGGMADWSKNGDACMKWRRFHNLFEASQTLFWAGFGMIGLDDFELTGAGGYTRFWSMLMFGAYSVINIIVLLNLLIAMMSNSYSFIVEHADTEWKFARTKLWMSFFEERCTLPPPFNIFPNVKFIKSLFSRKPKKTLTRELSARTLGRECKARDFRYLSVMRALIWRYMCSLQKSSIERSVTEDDVNEVKDDISSLRFELIELFRDNGMNTSNCENKSKAALGRKMKIWERRLMRDFHVSPAMGSENVDELDKIEMPTNTNDQVYRIVKLAMLSKATDIGDGTGSRNGNQIGTKGQYDEAKKNTLKRAMEDARRKMQEDDGSPYSSRGCSPFPELYKGPQLLQAIENLDLTPDTSTQVSPMLSNRFQMNVGKGQAKDTNTLTVPDRRPPSALKKAPSKNEIALKVPTNVYHRQESEESLPEDSSEIEIRKASNNLLSMLTKDKNVQKDKTKIDLHEENKAKEQVPPRPKEVSKIISNFSNNEKDEKRPSMIQQKIESFNTANKTSIPPPSKPQAPKPNFSQAAVIKPTSQIAEKTKSHNYEPVKKVIQPSAPETEYNAVSELEDMEFVRKPRRMSKQSSQDLQ